MVLDLDLNNPPPVENSIQSNSPELPDQGNGISQGQTTNIVEIYDDDDIEVISPRDFAEATRNSRRNQELVFESLEDLVMLGEAEKAFPGYPIMDLFEVSIQPRFRLVNQRQSVANRRMDTSAISQTLTPTPAAPTFNCGICIEPLVEETATKCGHIFCKICIKAAILSQRKCPTCRQKLNRQDTIRIYLPNSS